MKRKKALITGGSRGIGRACALALAGEGIDVAILARNEINAQRVAGEVRELVDKAKRVRTATSRP